MIVRQEFASKLSHVLVEGGREEHVPMIGILVGICGGQ